MGTVNLTGASGFNTVIDGGNPAANKTMTMPTASGTMVTTVNNTAPNAAGNVTLAAGNGPAFEGTASGSQSVNSGAYTKVLFATENYDTNSNFTSSTFTPTIAGYYQINCNVTLGTTAGEFVLAVYKNGSLSKLLLDYTPTNTYAFSSGVLISMNGSTDYLDIYVFQSSGTAKTVSSLSYFQGFLARAA